MAEMPQRGPEVFGVAKARLHRILAAIAGLLMAAIWPAFDELDVADMKSLPEGRDVATVSGGQRV